MNCPVKSLSDARLPRPSVSFGVSIDSAEIELSGFRRAVTVTSPPKPFAVALTGSADSTPSPAITALIALSAAVEVTVAPVSASMPSSPYVNGPLFPINCLVKSFSDARLPKPSVSPGVSIARYSIVPSAALPMVTVTSPPKPVSVADDVAPV